VASRNVKILVVGNPANTNCWILRKFAPDIPEKNFSSLSRLDHNRIIASLALELNVNPNQIKNVISWGNHSNTLYPDISNAVLLSNGNVSVKSLVEDNFYKNTLVPSVQNRGSQIIKVRGQGSSLSASKAIADHMRDWMFGTPPGEWTSMGVVSDGSYGIEPGLVFSFPVTIRNGEYNIVKGLQLNDKYSNEMINTTLEELIEERQIAASQI